MRELFVSGLAKELLGPRNGPGETLSDNPLDEYVTGVLAPASADIPRDADAEAELPTDEYEGEEEETEIETDIQSFSPVLSPMHRPLSLGLSFVVTHEAESELDVCVTWARYEEAIADGNAVWIRRPRVAIVRGRLTPRTVWLGSGGICAREQAEVSFHLSERAITAGRSLVTLQLVNRILVPDGDFPTTSHHIFQPQLRVVCTEGAGIVPGLEGRVYGQEERVLQFLHRRHPLLARGHLCSAQWRSIDPENSPADISLEFPDAAASVPFSWSDGSLLPENERRRFSPADVRTEYLPILSVPTPRLDVANWYGRSPNLRANDLAELWNAADLREALLPLVVAYRHWIQLTEAETTGLDSDERALARGLFRNCEATAERIEGGIALLTENPEARLAFCFAMRAMDMQARWPMGENRRPLQWRPFQLAFVLLTVESIVNRRSADREVCDLLWVPTGGGKTEAYLAIAAFALAFRRRRGAIRNGLDSTGGGVGVISRYTLRLLTIQQFRRTLKLITACEVLRVHLPPDGQLRGWRPTQCTIGDDLLWGTQRFSLGLWVGGAVTPNRFNDVFYNGRVFPGAISILTSRGDDAEPAQVLKCPCCDGILSVPSLRGGGFPEGEHRIHWTIRAPSNAVRVLVGQETESIRILDAVTTRLPDGAHSVISLHLLSRSRLTSETVSQLWDAVSPSIGSPVLACVRADRPGYYLRFYSGSIRAFDFDIICPNPDCGLKHSWFEGLPAGNVHGAPARCSGPAGDVIQHSIPRFTDGSRLVHVQSAFRANHPFVADRVPIPALTVDEQIYRRCPSIVIATVDKFARPTFESRAASIFGNVDFHHCLHGFYRACHPHPSPAGRGTSHNYVSVRPFGPPDLILQDELHLVEGPLGSLVGLIETAVDFLCSEVDDMPIKYIASTATIRQANEQVRCVFNRELNLFPPPGHTSDDSFFVRSEPPHALLDSSPGRLYMGICAPGRGPLMPLIRIWSRLLQTGEDNETRAAVDPYWTLVGYFNAIRELAGARALYRQDIPERISHIAGPAARELSEERSQELSGRMQATELPTVLEMLQLARGQDAVFTTSMFGTGVDVPRLGLMVVNGQPKTTSSYIQATGRVGREVGAFVPVFLRAARPRDLNHYEYFCGYHQQLHRFVEPITVMPFAPGVLERACGPVGVFLLRNRRNVSLSWATDSDARNMATARATSREVNEVPTTMELRALSQPPTRRPTARTVLGRSESALDDWNAVARRHRNDLIYVEYGGPPFSPVVLGDPQHQYGGAEVVYANAPQSLRDIEETCGFQT